MGMEVLLGLVEGFLVHLLKRIQQQLVIHQVTNVIRNGSIRRLLQLTLPQHIKNALCRNNC